LKLAISCSSAGPSRAFVATQSIRGFPIFSAQQEFKKGAVRAPFLVTISVIVAIRIATRASMPTRHSNWQGRPGRAEDRRQRLIDFDPHFKAGFSLAEAGFLLLGTGHVINASFPRRMILDCCFISTLSFQSFNFRKT
jgi:hypothetical protein